MNWVTKVQYIAELRSTISSSLDGTIVLSEVNTGKCIRKFKKHDVGVYSFVYSKKWGFMASVGASRSALIWNPKTGEVISTLMGHKTSIQEVLIDQDSDNLITISNDKCIIIWDCERFHCRQQVFDFTLYGSDNRFTAALWDSKHHRLLTANISLTAWPIKRVRKIAELTICDLRML